MVDGYLVEVTIQRNSKEENQQLNEGKIPEDWKDNPNKLHKKDVDAKWVNTTERIIMDIKVILRQIKSPN